MSYLYVVEGDKESEDAIRMLDKSGIKFRKVVIDKDDNGKSMFRDLVTTETPSLATFSAVYIGFEGIKSFIEQREAESGQ